MSLLIPVLPEPFGLWLWGPRKEATLCKGGPSLPSPILIPGNTYLFLLSWGLVSLPSPPLLSGFGPPDPSGRWLLPRIPWAFMQSFKTWRKTGHVPPGKVALGCTSPGCLYLVDVGAPPQAASAGSGCSELSTCGSVDLSLPFLGSYCPEVTGGSCGSSSIYFLPPSLA